ncbi:MAG: mechanosensitive ion channel domain-containing protein, partial [Cellvibrionaceae bacterium]
MKLPPFSAQHFRHTLAALLLALCATSPSLWATTPGDSAEPEAQARESAQTNPVAEDALGRSTPRGAFEGYIKAVAREDYERAAEYLNLSSLPASGRIRGQRVARILQQTLDRDGSVPPAVLLSDKPEGQLDDDQAPELERVGSLQIGEVKVALLLERVERDGELLWLIASRTLSQLPQRITDESALPINQVMPNSLIEHKWNGVPLGHWIAMLLLAGLCYLFSRVCVALVAGMARAVLTRKLRGYPTGLVRAFAGPIQLFMAVLLFVTAARRAGISIIVRQNLSEAVVIVAWVSMLWLIWRLVDVTAAVSEKRLTSQGRFGALSAVLLLRRGSRILLVVVGVIVALHMAGVNVATGLAALGIGGIVIALGAQKMVENLVGSVTLIFDQPVRVGDFCKVGTTTGTIEQIGMRSTRIRTLDRTVV